MAVAAPLAVSDDFIGPDNQVAQHPLTDYMLAHGITARVRVERYGKSHGR